GGDGGAGDEVRGPRSEVGRVREAELIASLEVLGVTEPHWLDSYDGTCAGVDRAEAVGKVLAIMREVQPNSVFTFGPDGMTGHADHKALSAWTRGAVSAASPP